MTWLALLAAALLAPRLTGAPTAGEELTRQTVRLSLLFYALTAGQLLLLRPSDGESVRRARLCWTLGWATYLVHVGLAFHYYFHWSHATAVAHTRAASGVGEGIYVSHLFTLLWTADVAAWWLRPAWYARRPPWIGRALHGFMAFVVFNATVVYASGFARWAGVVLFAGLGGCLAFRLAAVRRTARA